MSEVTKWCVTFGGQQKLPEKNGRLAGGMPSVGAKPASPALPGVWAALNWANRDEMPEGTALKSGWLAARASRLRC